MKIERKAIMKRLIFTLLVFTIIIAGISDLLATN